MRPRQWRALTRWVIPHSPERIVPMWLPELVKNRTAMQAMMGMKKIDLAELERARKKSDHS